MAIKAQERKSVIKPMAIETLVCAPAGVTQREFSEAKGLKIARDFDINKLGYPTVNETEDTNWVIDGQHRVWALRQQTWVTDDMMVECSVHHNLSKEKMAELFLGLNDTKIVLPLQQFLVAVTARHPEEVAINEVVLSTNLKVKKGKDHGYLGAVTALKHVYKTGGEDLLRRVLTTLRDGFEGSANAFGAFLLKGTALFYERYGEKIDDQEVIKTIENIKRGPNGLLLRAEEYHERLRRPYPECVARAVVDAVNKKRGRRAKLPSWSK